MNTQTYKLHSFVINCGSIISATAVVRLIVDGEEKEHVARGTDILDAAFKAIDRIVKRDVTLLSCKMSYSLSDGKMETNAEVDMALLERQVKGFGKSYDIIEAGILAYLDALEHLC